MKNTEGGTLLVKVREQELAYNELKNASRIGSSKLNFYFCVNDFLNFIEIKN
jgi:hypothetical protein